MIPVVGKFIPNPKPDKQGDCHTGSEASDVDKRIPGIFKQVSDSNLEVVFNHGSKNYGLTLSRILRGPKKVSTVVEIILLIG
jgi:hypothetical protein